MRAPLRLPTRGPVAQRCGGRIRSTPPRARDGKPTGSRACRRSPTPSEPRDHPRSRTAGSTREPGEDGSRWRAVGSGPRSTRARCRARPCSPLRSARSPTVARRSLLPLYPHRRGRGQAMPCTVRAPARRVPRLAAWRPRATCVMSARRAARSPRDRRWPRGGHARPATGRAARWARPTRRTPHESPARSLRPRPVPGTWGTRPSRVGTGPVHRGSRLGARRCSP